MGRTAFFLATVIGPLFLGAPSGGAGEPGPPDSRGATVPCLEQLHERAQKGALITIVDTSGVSIRGKLRRVDLDSGILSLEVYDSRTSRFGVQDIPLRALDLVRGRSSHTSLKPAVFSAILLGSFGLIIGQGFANDPDSGSADSRMFWEVGLPVLGAATGFAVGGILTPTRTREWEIFCVEQTPGTR